MTDLDKILNTLDAPEPSRDLKTRILEAAKEQSPRSTQTVPQAANDNNWKRWSAMAAMAIFAAAVGLTFLPSQSADMTDADLWAEKAEDIGYEDLYAWVQGEDTEVYDAENERNESSLYQAQMPI
jgi:hypothetical protein